MQTIDLFEAIIQSQRIIEALHFNWTIKIRFLIYENRNVYVFKKPVKVLKAVVIVLLIVNFKKLIPQQTLLHLIIQQCLLIAHRK